MEIKLNPKEQKDLSFTFEIEGLNEELHTRLIFPMTDGLSLVYESPIVAGVADLHIPALNRFYKDIKTSEVMLEVVSDTKRFETWKGSVEFEQEDRVVVKEMTDTSKTKTAIHLSTMTVTKPTTKPIVETKAEPVEVFEKKTMKDLIKGV
jgi:hypothetical protein